MLSAGVVFWGPALRSSGSVPLYSAMELVFQDVGQLHSSCRASIFGTPCSILPFPVPGIVLGSETWLYLPCPLHSHVQGV